MLDLVHAAEVIVPPHPGLFSALGLVSSDQVFETSRSASAILPGDAAGRIPEMEAAMRGRLRGAGSEVRFVRRFDGQLAG